MTKIKKVGRPKAAKGKAKSDRIQARLTPSERQKIDTAVQKSGLKESAWVRKALMDAAS